MLHYDVIAFLSKLVNDILPDSDKHKDLSSVEYKEIMQNRVFTSICTVLVYARVYVLWYV